MLLSMRSTPACKTSVRLWPSRRQVGRLLRLVGEGGQGETAIGEAHPLGIVAENLVSCFDDLALVFRQCLPPRLFDAVLQNELMHLRHDRERDAHLSHRQSWSLVAEAIRRY